MNEILYDYVDFINEYKSRSKKEFRVIAHELKIDYQEFNYFLVSNFSEVTIKTLLVIRELKASEDLKRKDRWVGRKSEDNFFYSAKQNKKRRC